jgi:hypothetical protein
LSKYSVGSHFLLGNLTLLKDKTSGKNFFTQIYVNLQFTIHPDVSGTPQDSLTFKQDSSLNNSQSFNNFVSKFSHSIPQWAARTPTAKWLP